MILDSHTCVWLEGIATRHTQAATVYDMITGQANTLVVA